MRTHSAEKPIHSYPQILVIASPTSGGLSVGIVRLQTKSHGVCFVSYRSF
jgi:hypothetical protein